MQFEGGAPVREGIRKKLAQWAQILRTLSAPVPLIAFADQLEQAGGRLLV